MKPEPNISLTAAKRAVDRWVTRGPSWASMRGYEWYREAFSPSIRALEEAGPSVAGYSRLSRAFYLMGDLSLFIDALRSARRAYVSSHIYDLTHSSDALENVATVSLMVGDRQAAIKWLRYAAQVKPYDRHRLAQMEVGTDEGLKGSLGADIQCIAHELILKGKAQEVIGRLARSRAHESQSILMRAYCAINDSSSALTVLGRRLRYGPPVRFETADWFFLTDELWDSCVFWSMIEEAVGDVQQLALWSVLPGDHQCGPPELSTGLRSIVHGPARPTKRALKVLLRTACEFHVARTSGNARMLATLIDRFPRWREPAVAHECLEEHGVCPTRKTMLEWPKSA